MAGPDARSRLPRALVRLSIRRPRAVLLSWLFVGSLASFGAIQISVETSTDSILDRNGPEWTFYQESQRLFGGDEILTILIEAPSPYDPTALAEVERLTRALEEVEGVWRVDSLATVPLVHGDGSGFVSLEPALAGGVPTEEADLRALESLVRRDRIAPEILVSGDGRFFGVNVVLEQGAERHYRPVLERIEQELEGSRAWVSGVPIFRIQADSRTRRELMIFVPITVVAMALLLYFMFRSVAAVLIPLLASGVATWIVIGAMGAVGVPIRITTVVLPSILLALGCAFVMHILTAAGGSRSESELRERIESVALPVALSGLTTAIGFIAVSFVRIEAIRDIGTYGAIGVLAVLAATLTAAPAALRLWPMSVERRVVHARLASEQPERLVALIERRGGVVIVAWLVALCLVGVGISRIKVETDVIVWFPEDDPIRVAYSRIRDELSGISPMNIVIEAPEGETVNSTEAMAAIDALTRHLESLEEVGRAIAITDPVRAVHGAFVGDPSNPLPLEQQLIDQYLVLLESKDYTHDLIAIDHRAANVLMRVDDNASGALLGVAAEALSWWKEHGPEDYEARATGIMFEFARAEDAIAYGQLRGLAFALGAVAVVLYAIFRQLRLAMVALIPNAIPVAMAFGLMGLLGIPLDAGTVVLGNLALGIAVDDTIHVVSGFYEAGQAGRPSRLALVDALRRALPAVVLTTIAVTLGFVILSLSSFTVTRHLGLLTGGIMVICLLADVFLLPALLLRLPEGRGGGTSLKADS